MKNGQDKTIWKDLSGNGNDCEVHREVFEYPPALEGGRNLLRNSDFSFGGNMWDGNFNITEEGALLESVAGRSDYIQNTTLIPEGEYVVQIRYRVVEGQAPYLYVTNGTDMTSPEGLYVFAIGDNEWQTVTIPIIVNSESRFYAIRYAAGFPVDHLEGKTLIKWIKLEKGSQATPWTPAPEDLGLEYPDWVQNFHPGLKDRWYENKLYFINSDSHIQIPEINLNPNNFTIQVDNKIRAFNGDKVTTENGDEWGRNLLRNSDFKFGFDVYWDRFNSSPLSNFTITSEGLLKVTKSSDYADFGKRNFISLNNLGDVENLTASAWVKGNGEFTIRFGNSSNRIETVNSDTIKKYVFHIPKSRFGNEHLVISVTSGEIFFDRVKAEIGDKATPWTPAPEDITETNIINHNTPFVENNTIHTLRFYNRALTDEEILQNYQATHFLLEPKTFTSNDYYNYYDLNRVEINTLATKDLAEVLREVLRGDINLEDIVFDRDMKSIPFADVLNRVEGNINILGNKLYKPKGWISPKLEWDYNQPFSYEDANRLEYNLLLLYNYAKGNIDKIPYCGMINVGEEVI